MKRMSTTELRQRMEALTAPLLLFLASEPTRFERFLALTGLDVQRLRAASRDDGFAASLWSYLGSDEPLLLAFAREQDIDQAEIAMMTMMATDQDAQGG